MEFVGVLAAFGYACAFSSTSRLKSRRETHRVVVPERLHQTCRSEFIQVEAEYPKGEYTQCRPQDLLTVALSMFVL